MSVPVLRFPEFEGEWEEKPIGERLSKVIDYRGKAPPKSETGMPLITARNVRMGHLDFTADEYIHAELYEDWMNRGLPKPDDVMFTTEAPLGNVAQYPHEGTYALGQRIITLQAKEDKLSSGFLFQFLIGPIGQKKVDMRGTGSTAKGIKSKVFVKIPMAAPIVEEQKKIAAFLGVVDEKLAALGARKAGLETYKRGLMQKLFSRTLRFIKPDGSPFPDWEEKRLGDFCHALSGHPVAGDEIIESPNEFPLLRGINITEGSIRHSPEMDKFHGGEVEGLERFLVEAGDVVVAMDGSKVGKNVATVTEQDAGSFLIQRVTRLRVNGKNDVRLVYQHVTSHRFRNYVDIVNTSSGIPHISLKQIRDFPIPMPHPEEQTLIANALQTLDAKILTTADQITRMEGFKKGLLQQMFV